MRISDWSSDVCSSDLRRLSRFSLILSLDWICHGRANLRGASSVLRCWPKELARRTIRPRRLEDGAQAWPTDPPLTALKAIPRNPCQPTLLYQRPVQHQASRSEEHTSELQSQMRHSVAGF